MKQAAILEIIENGLKVDKGTLTMESTMDSVQEWDSLGHIGMLVALDEAFEGKVASIDEMGTANSTQRIIEILKENAIIDG